MNNKYIMIVTVGVFCLTVGVMFGSAQNSFSQVKTSHIERIHPQELSLSSNPHVSRVIRVTGGRHVYISGVASYDEAGKLVGEGDIAVQAEQAYKRLGVALRAAGATPSDVVTARIYVVNLKPGDAEKMSPSLEAFYPEGDRPTNTLIGVQGLYTPGALVEIEAVAVIPEA